MKNFKIAISGSGTPDEIINALKSVIDSINEDTSDEVLDGAVWEDSILLTQINAE